jgi:hypothetical protein
MSGPTPHQRPCQDGTSISPPKGACTTVFKFNPSVNVALPLRGNPPLLHDRLLLTLNNTSALVFPLSLRASLATSAGICWLGE